ncbi:hypothetical protein SUGI_0893910 [Cryptomeria japonica]|uniref:phospholipase A1-Igamma2, chloroplastic-like n=1 Tax=Cryptomeria japonica TaxID=3369 RepID=UPI0024146BE1|nr:phospholipase A1-Igamma2, chloroplastic-like [Cryptomeria japonica]GLJ43065.1 hypothetical protein SUGI_0893910 [Cryptomeria japonica]
MAISRLVLGNWKEANENTNGDAEDKSDQLKVCDMWRDIQGANHWNGLLDPINPLLKAEQKLARPETGFPKLWAWISSYQIYIYANTSLLDSIFGEESSEGVAWIGYIAVCNDPDEIKRLGRRDMVHGEARRLHLNGCKISETLVPAMVSKATTCSNIQTISNPDARIEKGFLSCYTATDEDSVRCKLSARDTVVGEITRLVKEYKEKEEDLSITFIGHSLGAALATLSAYDIKQIMVNEYGVTSIPVTLFSFASPRVGNLSFAQHMEEIGVKVLRVVNHKDLVPKAPGIFFNENLGWLTRLLHWLPWAYVHVGVEISLDSSSSAFLKHMHNPANLHNLEVYLHALDGFQGNNKLPFKPSGRDPSLVNKHSDLLIESLQIPSNWWEKRNKEVVKRIDGMLVYSPTTPTPVPLPQIPL